MHTLTRVHMKQVNLRTVADIKRLDPNTHGWIRVVERGLSQIIVLFRRRHPIELPVSNSDSNNAALRISHADDGFGEIFRLDTERLSLEPLIFRQTQEEARVISIVSFGVHTRNSTRKAF